MKVSVIIPTFNNAKILPICLDKIFSQTVSKADYEVLVINDASKDETIMVLEKIKEQHSDWNLRLLNYFENKGPAASRDLGILEATTPLLIFTQDDIFVESDFIEKHLKFHELHPEKEFVLVGKTIFDPAVGSTPFMRWLEDGHQFRFPFEGQACLTPTEVTDRPYLNFYTPNLSLKREFVMATEGFDETLYVPGGITYEDTELGYRLWKMGMHLYFDLSLKVLHHHFKSLESICRLRFLSGQTARKLYKKHPELQNVFRDQLKTKFTKIIVNDITIKLLLPIADFCERRINFSLLFWLVCRYYYNRGYRGS